MINKSKSSPNSNSYSNYQMENLIEGNNLSRSKITAKKSLVLIQNNITLI
jgi:hypothetical protein